MSSTKSTPARIDDLLRSAHDEGELSTSSMAALTIDADIGQRIQAGMGIAPDDVPASEVVLVTMMPDDSGSIRFAGNAGLVREGHNLVLDALLASRQSGDVLAHTRYLNGRVLFPYRPLKDAVRMDTKNYDPSLGTPLYDQIAVVLGTVLAKSREFERSGVPVRTVTLLLTDGADEGSVRQSAATVRPIVEDLLRKETHVVAAMGLDDGSTDFKVVFREIGIPDAWILTPGASPQEVRRAFQVFSQSAVRVSQGAVTLHSLDLGGFAN
jgi:hypothetical protein